MSAGVSADSVIVLYTLLPSHLLDVDLLHSLLLVSKAWEMGTLFMKGAKPFPTVCGKHRTSCHSP